VSYKIGFDGVVTAELDKLLQSIERQVNGFGMHAQTSDGGMSMAESGSTTVPCPPGHICPGSVKYGHDWVVIGAAVGAAVVAGAVAGAVVGALTGYAAGKVSVRSVKSGHD
jgi:hypothetical protein